MFQSILSLVSAVLSVSARFVMSLPFVMLAPSTIRAKMRAGEFPASLRLSYKLAVWNLDEIEAWFQQRLAAAPLYVPHLGVRKSNAVAEVAND